MNDHSDSEAHVHSAACSHGNTGCELTGLWWWTTLVVAVLAVPAIGSVVAMMLPLEGSAQLPVFIIVCWLSTYIGMLLMRGTPHKKK